MACFYERKNLATQGKGNRNKFPPLSLLWPKEYQITCFYKHSYNRFEGYCELRKCLLVTLLFSIKNTTYISKIFDKHNTQHWDKRLGVPWINYFRFLYLHFTGQSAWDLFYLKFIISGASKEHKYWCFLPGSRLVSLSWLSMITVFSFFSSGASKEHEYWYRLMLLAWITLGLAYLTYNDYSDIFFLFRCEQGAQVLVLSDACCLDHAWSCLLDLL